MPAVTPEVNRSSRYVIKLSLGITLAVSVAVVLVIVLSGTSAEASTYSVTTSGGTSNWTAPSPFSWTCTAGAPGSTGCGSYPGDPTAPGAADGDIANVNGVGGGLTVSSVIARAVTVNINNSSTVTISGSGALTLTGNSFVNSGALTISGGTFTNNAGSTINAGSTGAGGTLTLSGGTLQNDGTITISGAMPSPGTFAWSGGTLNGAGTTVIAATPVNAALNVNGPVILGGSETVNVQGTLNLGNSIANSGTGAINLTGTLSQTPISATIAPTFNNGGTVALPISAQSLSLTGGGTHAGLFNFIGPGSTLSLNGTHTFGAGSSFAGLGNVSILGGTFQVNTGLTIPGNLTNGGILAFGPGGTTQGLAVSGNFNQGAAGSLQTKINGTVAGSGYDQVRVSGIASLNGGLNAPLGFPAVAGQFFDIITDSSVSGDFSSTVLGSGGTVVLQEIPKPPSGTQVRLVAVNVADVSIAKTGPLSVADGANATFTIKVGNNGPATATNVVVTDTITGGTLVSVSGGGCTAFPCTIPSIAPATSVTITEVVNASGVGTLTNTASATPAEFDNNSGNNTSTATVTVNPAADVSVGPISATPSAPNASQPVTWTVPVGNAGPDTPASTTLQLSLNGGSISSVTAAGGGFSCSNTATTVTCTSSTFAPGSAAITVIAAPPAAGGAWTMTGNISVAPPASDPNGANNTSTATVNVAPSADVSISKTGPATVVAGSTVTYNISVTNAGPSGATNVTVSDPTPAGLLFVSTTASCGTLPCNIGPLAAGATAGFTVTFNVPLTAPSTVTNIATVTATESDPTPGNNSSSVTSTVVQQADLVVTKKGPSAATPGSNVTFTITVTNNGPSIASNVTLADPTPARLTFVSASAPCASGFASPCALGNLNPLTSKTVSVTYSVTPGGATTTTNQATASSATTDPNPGNNTGTATLAIGTCPVTPGNQQPPDGATDQQTTGVLIWSDANATSYNVFLGPVGQGCSSMPVATVRTPAYLYTGLQPGTTYEWRVEAVTPGCPIRSSTCIKFTTTGSACPTTPPTLISPLNTTVNGPATFTWSSVTGAKDYQLFVNGNFVTKTMATSVGPISVANGPVVWFVIVDFDNCPSITSSNGSFNSCDTTAKTIPSIVAQSDSGQSYTLFWDALSGATKYEVDEAKDVNFTNPTTLTATGTSLSFQHAVTTPTAFFYRVRAFFACANAFGSNSVSVRIVLSPVTAPSNPNVSAPSGSDTLIPIVVHVAGFPDGTFPFTASPDPLEPWLVRVEPSSGLLPPDGINLTVFANPAGLPTGTHTGTVIVLVTTPSKGGLTANGVTPVGAPVSISLVTPVTPKPSGPPPLNALIIPSTGHLDGINSRWASDVRILNTSSQSVHYQITFTPDDTTQGVKQTVIETSAGSTTALDDVVKTWYGVGSLGESSNGSLEIRPLDNPAKTGSEDAPSISFTTVASSRTYNAAPNSAAGTLGEFIPAILFQNFVGKAIDANHAATILSLQQIAQNDSMRTNFGVMEASGQPASVLISVFDSAGKKLLDSPLALQGGQHAQLNGFLAQNKISLNDGRIQVQVVGGDGKVTAYASVIDNKSGDPVLVSGVPLGQNSADTFVLAGVADLNTGNAAWRTDMRIFNPTSTALNAQLTFYPMNAQGQPQSTSISINPGEVKQLNSTLQSTFGLTNVGGAIHVQTATAQPLIVSGRTYDLTSNGTFGQLLNATTARDAIGKGDSALQVLQVEDSMRERTNVGIFEVTGKPATVEVTLFLPDSKTAPSTQIPLPANGFMQIPIVSSFGFSNVYNARVSMRVVDGDGRVGAYGSVIDQITQAPTLIPAQK